MTVVVHAGGAAVIKSTPTNAHGGEQWKRVGIAVFGVENGATGDRLGAIHARCTWPKY
jgi:hypothetical protein